MWQRGEFRISTDSSLLDFAVIHRFLSQESYWAQGRSPEVVRMSMDNSAYCFGVYHHHDAERKQIGFARVISDLATFGYLADVFILGAYRGQGLGKWLLRTITDHPDLVHVPWLALFTNTPRFYEDFGFSVFEQTPERAFLTRRIEDGERPPS